MDNVVSPRKTVAVEPLPSGAVTLGDGELGRWRRRTARHTAPHVMRKLDEAGNMFNLETVARGLDREYIGSYPFLDTDVYKTVEGLAHLLSTDENRDDREDMLAFVQRAIQLIEAAQADDGYLNSAFQNPAFGRTPWSDLAWGHELYNLGHLIQAALGVSRGLGDDRLLTVAQRFADLAVSRFGPDGAPAVCGHPEVEMALVELYRWTGRTDYLDLARLFIDRRGHRTIAATIFPHDYFQDAVPLRALPSVTGHAVRMGYLAAGATDVAIETDDAELLAAMERLFADMVATKLHFTGGLGSRHDDEGIGDRYELTPDRAYSETCAAISVMQWSWRLFLATGESHYLDTFEWVLYNAYAVGTSDDGSCFFYDNPLQRRADHHVPPEGRPLREPWFVCPCCPPNVLRWNAQLPDYVAVSDGDGVRIAFPTSCTVVASGLVLRVETDYPWDGSVSVSVIEAPTEPRTVSVRVPGWVEGASISDGDGVRDAEPGWATVRRVWRSGDRFVLDLPMPVRAHVAHPHLDSARGAVAFARGPIAYCAEGLDSDTCIDDLVVDDVSVAEASAHWRASTDGLDTAHAAISLTARVAAPAGAQLYPLHGTAGDPPDGRVAATLRPYFLWGNRGLSTMRVWLRAR